MWLLLVAALAAAARAAARDFGHGAFNASYSYSDRIVFPDHLSPTSYLARSLDLARQMNSLRSEEDFLKLFHYDSEPETNSAVLVLDRSGLEGSVEQERSLKRIRAKPAHCQPEPQVVQVVNTTGDESMKRYFPSCVRINRCGGCCNHELMSCQPTASEIHNYEIRVVHLRLDGTVNHTSKLIVPLEEHIKCDCGCTKKEKDCTDKQYYLKEECRCDCKNKDEKNKCQQQSDIKFWDPNSCACHCRKAEECSTNSYFDPNSCSCKSLYSEQWLNERRTGYNNFRQFGKPRDSQPVIVPLDANDPRRKHKEDPEYK